MRDEFRSECAIASSLDVLGDRWSLLIVRDMLIGHKYTFKEFSLSKEGVATGILSKRLKCLEGYGIISKRKLPGNKKENIYLLTERGVSLAPLIIEITVWGDANLRDYNKNLNHYEMLKADSQSATRKVREAYIQFTEGFLNASNQTL